MNSQYDLNPQINPQPKSKHSQCSYFLVSNLLLALFLVYSFAFWNNNTLSTLNYPSDSYGHVCYLQYPQTYPFLFADFSTPTPKLLCVSQCPSTANGYTILDSRGAQINAPRNTQTPNTALGGICLSNTTLSMMKKRGLYSQIESKLFLLNKQNIILRICVGAAVLSALSAILVFCLPLKLVTYGSMFLSFGLVLALMIWMNITTLFFYHIQMTILLALLVIIMAINIYLFKQKLQESIQFSQQLKQKMQKGHDSSILKFIKCFRIPLALTLVQFALLILVVIQYIALASNQQLVKNHSTDIYYTIKHTWWKYLLLAFEWLFLSHLAQNYYQFHIVRTGYQIVKEQPIVFACPTFKDVLSIYHLTAIQTLLWVPLKIAALVKPQGSIVNKNDSMTFAQKYSQACYCCCGAIINYLHKFSVNPFLVVTLQPSFEDLNSSLEIVQETYHRADPAFDKSSLWLYRFSNYINIAFLSMAFVTLDSHASNPFALSSFANWFLVFGVVVTVEMGQYFLTLQSLMTQVGEFHSIFSNQQWA